MSDIKAEFMRRLEELTEVEKEAVLGYLRMMKGQEPCISPDALLLMHRSLLRMKHDGIDVPDGILTRLTEIVEPA